MVDHVTPSRRSEIMASIGSKGTVPELTVRKILYSMGYRYRLHVRNLPGKPDIVFKSRKKVIFVHGCFWHRHSKCRYTGNPKTRIEYWNKKFDRNMQRDKKTLLKLKAMGWDVLIVWQCQIKDSDLISTKMRNFLEMPNRSKQRIKNGH